jgi:hypothetical protein
MRHYVTVVVCLLLMLLSGSGALAQTSSTRDSLHASLRGRVSIGGGFDSRNSFISNRRAHIWGIKAAAELGDLVQLGVGYNRHDNNLNRTVYFSTPSGSIDSANGELHMDYVSWYARYVFFRKGRWKFAIIPFQLGVGRSRYMYMRGEEKVFTAKKSIVVYETGFNISFKIFKWLGVGGDIGVRWMLKDNPAIPEKFNSPQYSFYTIIYWTEIVRAIAPENKFVKRL